MGQPLLLRGRSAARDRVAALAALACGLALRLWFALAHPQVFGDALVYGALAKNLLLHGVYGFRAAAGLQPTLIRLPGYPLFLAVCFRMFGMEHYGAVLLAQVAIDLATCALVAALAANLFGRRTGLVALCIAALCPFTANYVAAPLTETLSIFCVAMAFYALERWRGQPRIDAHFWLIVFALGYAILLRPDGGLLAAAVCPAMLAFAWRRCGARRALALVAACGICALLPLAPWTARNWRDFHALQPLAPFSATDPGEFVDRGFNRWYRTWAVDYVSTEEVYWPENNDAIDIASLPARAFDSSAQKQQTAALLDDYNQTTTMTPALDARFGAIGEQRIAANPLRYHIALPMARLADMWLRPRLELMPQDARWWQDTAANPRQRAIGLAYGGLNLLYLTAAALGAWRILRAGPGSARAMLWPMLMYVLLRSALLATLDNSEPRYTLECFPLVMVLAAALVARGKREDYDATS